MPFAETIGLIASCVQLAELATKSIKNLHSFELKFKNAATTFELLSAQLLALKSAAKHISLWLDEAPPESIWSAELRDDLVRSIEACGTLLQKISDHSFRLDHDSRTALLRERMKYVWKADEFREYQDLSRDHVQALSFLLQVAQLSDQAVPSKIPYSVETTATVSLTDLGMSHHYHCKETTRLPARPWSRSAMISHSLAFPSALTTRPLFRALHNLR
ncbi:hypothetical protein EV356DRAFT_505167 [Viridothelium virens]|uniref:Fungal N-terminal domain-containing protein n=1 Tax=Viridothelium virens TaxID=1048519 RepID=A0A6A6H371_VIRVR|nr:hypothetical protein EV356DRAFT_505167 [Viridothelium virens]